MVQKYGVERGIVKLDGYNVQSIKTIRGSSCKFCKKNKGLTACFFKKCKAFYHLPCGIKAGSLQIKGKRRSICPQHREKYLNKYGSEVEQKMENSENSKITKNIRKKKVLNKNSSTPLRDYS